MTKKNKLLLAFMAVLSSAFTAYSLPGITSADVSGEYAYYQDFTFSTPSYIGVIYYDDSTYGLRCITENASGEPRDISVYLSVNPENSKIELTGETVTGAATIDDADIVNYLHDLMYELTERRSRVQLDFAGTVTTEDFPQFGGDVNISWSSLVPVFNLQQIVKTDNSPLLSLVTTGRVISAEDKSFQSFSGLSSIPADKDRSFTKQKKTKKLNAESGKLSLKLDTQWKAVPSVTNMWTYSDGKTDGAIVTLKLYNIDTSSEENTALTLNSFERQLRESLYGTWKPWNMTTSVSEKKSVSITVLSWDPETGDVVRSFNEIKITASGLAVCTMNVYDSLYKADKKYYDSILKSFSAK